MKRLPLIKIVFLFGFILFASILINDYCTLKRRAAAKSLIENEHGGYLFGATEKITGRPIDQGVISPLGKLLLSRSDFGYIDIHLNAGKAKTKIQILELVSKCAMFREATGLALENFSILELTDAEKLATSLRINRLSIENSSGINPAHLKLMERFWPNLETLQAKSLGSTKKIPERWKENAKMISFGNLQIEEDCIIRILESENIQYFGLDRCDLVMQKSDLQLAENFSLERLVFTNLAESELALRIAASARNLKSLYVVSCDLGEDAMLLISQLTALEELSIIDSQFHKSLWSELLKMNNLRRLVLNGSTFDSRGVGHLAHLPLLKELEMAGTELSREGIAELSALQNINFLSAPDNFLDKDRVSLSLNRKSPLLLRSVNFFGYVGTQELNDND